MAPKRHLLIAMDAFGTLFFPKPSIAEQYISLASKHGIPDLKQTDIETSFHKSFKLMRQQYPNYGKKAGLDTESWWKAVLERTFTPFVSEQQRLHSLPGLVPALIQRFWCGDGYELHQDAYRFVHKVIEYRKSYEGTGSVFLGVLSNSDTRLPDILKLLHYKVSSVGAASKDSVEQTMDQEFDIQFVVLSYDVGHEKPAREIFDATEQLVRTKLMPRENANDEITKFYVGDEWKNDGLGAHKAGWHAVVVDRADTNLAKFEGISKFITRLDQASSKEPPILESVSSLD